MTDREPGAVVVRTGRFSVLLMMAACGFILAGLVAGLWTSVVGGSGFSFDGRQTSWLWTAVAWAVLVPLTLLLTLAVVMLARLLIHPHTVVVSPRGYRRESRGRVEVDIAVADLTGVLFRPGGRATWQDSDPGDPSVRGVGRARLINRIELRAPQATVEVSESSRWREVVDLVRGWVAVRPELVDDEATRAFLLESPPAPHPSSPAQERLPGWPLGMVRLAIRRRDPWAPFLPDAYGQYSSMFNGRYTAARAPERGGRVGLVARWLFVTLWVAPFVVLLYLVGRLALLLV